MPRMIFPNLPVTDPAKSAEYYTGLGFTLNPQYSDDSAKSMVVSDTIILMLLRKDRFEEFLPSGHSGHLNSSAKEVLLSLTCDSRDEVDQFVSKAQASGGSVYQEAKEYMPGMYGASLADPDGHVMEVFWMSQETQATMEQGGE